MPHTVNKPGLKAFIHRRKSNALGLLIITAASSAATLLGALTGFAHTDLLAIVTVLLVLLCLLQLYRNRKGFRTIHAAKGLHKKKVRPDKAG